MTYNVFGGTLSFSQSVTVVCHVVTDVRNCAVQIRQAASDLELTEEQFVELQSQHWARFYSICVQYQQVSGW